MACIMCFNPARCAAARGSSKGSSFSGASRGGAVVNSGPDAVLGGAGRVSGPFPDGTFCKRDLCLHGQGLSLRDILGSSEVKVAASSRVLRHF
jgi:hypothetical protein